MPTICRLWIFLAHTGSGGHFSNHGRITRMHFLVVRKELAKILPGIVIPEVALSRPYHSPFTISSMTMHVAFGVIGSIVSECHISSNNYDGTSTFGMVGFGRSTGVNGDFFVMDFFDPKPESFCTYNVTNFEAGSGALSAKHCLEWHHCLRYIPGTYVSKYIREWSHRPIA